MSHPPTSSRPTLFVWVVCFLVCIVASVGNCTETPQTEATTETTLPPEPTTTDRESLADQRIEQPVETYREPKKETATTTESKQEPKREPSSDTQSDGGPSEPPSDVRDAGPTGPCTGVKGPYPEINASAPPERTIPESIPEGDECKYKPNRCKGALTPPWKLKDFQPQSCGYNKEYNLRAFRGHVTVVALLSGW